MFLVDQAQQEGTDSEALLGLREEALILELGSDYSDVRGDGVEIEGLGVGLEQEFACLVEFL